MMDVRETDLLGIGKKYHVKTSFGEDAVIVIHDDGRREIYSYDESENVSACVLTFNDDEARTVAGIIGGMYYKPKALETVEMALNDLLIEWYRVPDDSPVISRTIGELEVRKKTGAAIIAGITHRGTEINPGPDYVISRGATLVVAGERRQIKLLKDLLLRAA
jgi:TrkA domain protein